jgi:hypothetical protein
MRHELWAAVAAVVVSTTTGPALFAQETFTPVFQAPYRTFTQHEFGGSFSDPGSGASYALEGFYGYGYGRFDIGLRGGYEKFSNNAGSAVLLGASARTRVINASESIPLDGALTVGAGVRLGDGPDFFAVPIGVSVGRHVELEGSKVSFTPYAQPVIIPTFAKNNNQVNFALGLGADIRLSPAFSLRVSGGLGDIHGVGVSAAWIH